MRSLVILSLLFLGISAYELDPCTGDSCSSPLTVTSFNARTLQGRTRDKTRAVELAKFFANDTQTNFLCLQEVRPVVRRYLLSSLPDRWAYNFYASTGRPCRSECESEELSPIRNCLSGANCGNDFTCIFEECGEWLLRLDEECQVCLADNSTSSFDEQLTLCNEDNDDDDDDDACDNPVDNLILSTYPLSNTSYTSFDEDEKGLLFALGQLPDKIASLFCVSFTEVDDDDDDDPNDGVDDDDDDREDQRQEVSFVVSRANAQSSDRLVFLMGDFQTSPDVNPRYGITDESYSILANTLTEYTNVYVDCVDGRDCTVFPASLSDSPESHTDHLFVRNDHSYCLANVTAIVSTEDLGGDAGELYGLSIVACSSGAK